MQSIDTAIKLSLSYRLECIDDPRPYSVSVSIKHWRYLFRDYSSMDKLSAIDVHAVHKFDVLPRTTEASMPSSIVASMNWAHFADCREIMMIHSLKLSDVYDIDLPNVEAFLSAEDNIEPPATILDELTPNAVTPLLRKDVSWAIWPSSIWQHICRWTTKNAQRPCNFQLCASVRPRSPVEIDEIAAWICIKP